ncbi:hypothetical protein [Streptomyces sp. NPDC094149]|uniref:hypothetical protein n=1 Tax=Streptomyces sp. NPDC094149 TaxID=3155079 RepID=UPI003331985F
MADLQGQTRTAGAEAAVEDQGAADAPVPGGHAQQVPGAAAAPPRATPARAGRVS